MAFSKEQLLGAAPRIKVVPVPDFGDVITRTLGPKELVWYQQKCAENKENTDELVVINMAVFFGNEDGSRMFTIEEARAAIETQSPPGFVVTAVVAAGAAFNGLTAAAREEISGKS